MALDNQRETDEMYSVARLDSPEKLTRLYDRLKRGRQSRDSQWRLNLAFYKGKQYSYINRRGVITSLPVEPGDLPRYRVRIVANQIISGSQSLLSKYTKTKPIISATPGSSSDHDVKAAQMAENLLEYWWHEFALDDALEEALLWGIVAGQGYWKITWDGHAGKAMKFMLGPDGQPILDDSQKEAFRGQLAASGQQPEETTVYLGDIKVECMSPFNVFLDPSAKVFKDCKYAICVHYLDPDEIKGRWGVDVKPDSVPVPADVSLPFANAENASEKTVKRVYVGYFLPSPVMPKGRHVVWMDSPNKILQDDPWPYPSNELPLVKFPGIRVPGQVYDSSVVEHAIPMQKELNKTLSQIVEYKNLTIKPRVWAPVGSVPGKLTNEPGVVQSFIPVGGLKPEVERLPTMPPYVFEHLKEIRQSLRDVFSLAEVTEGTVPPNVEAGVAIDLLQEMSTDRLAPTIKLIEHGLARAGQLMLSLAQQYYIEPRLLKIKGSGGSVQVRKFTQADIDSGISVHVEAGSALPRTRAGRQARIQSYVEMGVLKPDQAWKYLDIGDMKSVSKMFQADEDMAYREHDRLARGIPINPHAIQQAMQVVAQGINPTTGIAFSSPQEAEQFVMDAGLEPLPYENSAMHLDTHGLFLKSVEFENLPEDAQHRHLVHYQKTFERVQSQQPLPQSEPTRTTLQLKGTIGPTGAAQILQGAHPGITPDVMAEPPLETWVTDSMDKPDVEGTGNDPYTQAEQAMQAQRETIKAIQAMNMADNQDARDDETHVAKLKEQLIKNQIAQKKLAQSDFRPKRQSSGSQ